MLETFSPENLSPGYLSDKSPENISGVKETFPEQLSEGNDNVPGEPPEEFVPEELRKNYPMVTTSFLRVTPSPFRSQPRKPESGSTRSWQSGSRDSQEVISKN